MPSHPRILVVGSGIVGASIAYHLARDGAAVRVLEADKEGGIATPRSWAWINASWGNPEPYFRLRIRSMAEWRQLGDEVAGLDVNWAGGLNFDLPPDRLETYAAEHASWGYGVRRVGRDEAARIEPALADPPQFALHIAEEGAVEPLAAAAALLAGAKTLGASVISGLRVLAVTKDGIDTDAGLIAADHVVVAAGAGAVSLSATAGFDLPITTPAGLLVATAPMPKLLNGLVLAPELHVRQTAEGRLVAGSDFGGADPGTEPDKAAAELFARMQRTLKCGSDLIYSHHTVGHRPTPIDGFPIVGRIPGSDRVSVAVTHSGITLAPAIGLFLAEEILTGRREKLLDRYRPERFSQADYSAITTA